MRSRAQVIGSPALSSMPVERFPPFSWPATKGAQAAASFGCFGVISRV